VIKTGKFGRYEGVKEKTRAGWWWKKNLGMGRTRSVESGPNLFYTTVVILYPGEFKISPLLKVTEVSQLRLH